MSLQAYFIFIIKPEFCYIRIANSDYEHEQTDNISDAPQALGE
jgi:hypothetical protein